MKPWSWTTQFRKDCVNLTSVHKLEYIRVHNHLLHVNLTKYLRGSCTSGNFRCIYLNLNTKVCICSIVPLVKLQRLILLSMILPNHVYNTNISCGCHLQMLPTRSMCSSWQGRTKIIILLSSHSRHPIE